MHGFSYRGNLLHAEDIPLTEIAERFGTPCYVYSHTALSDNWQAFSKGFAGRNATICYSVKSNSNLAVLSALAQLGSGFDIVSGGELQRVLKAGGRAGKTVFSGVGKSEDEIRLALEAGVWSLNLESEAEFERIEKVAGQLGTVAPISIRVNPDVDAVTHPHISTGMREAKFGIPISDAIRIYRQACARDCFRTVGIAVHIGSQITSMGPILDALERVIDLAEQLHKDGVPIEHLDLGGGLGIQYRDEQPPQINEYCSEIIRLFERRGCELKIAIEPGRAIAASAGIFLTTVEFIKNAEAKNFAIVDGAMNDLIRPVLYDAWMDIVPVRLGNGTDEAIYDVVGPVCESGDFLGKDRSLAIREGDLVAVRDAGAYGAVMSSNYNTRPRPPEIMVSGNRSDQVRARESIDQMFDLESIPERYRN
ncbi:MAG: diaminopimelate decarboxylase [Acidiferrobacterales bacterium]|nr:diaminopimelate decarboxylase [Acidiferrobacterales bacterium]